MTDELNEGQAEEVQEEAATSEDATEETEQETEEATEEETAESDAEEPPKKKSRGGFQKRIDELTRARYEADQRAQALERQLQEVQQQSQRSQYEQSKPTLEQYNYDHEQWAQAYEQWVVRGQEEQQRAAQEAQQRRQAQEQQVRRQMEIQQKVLKGQEKYPDFQARVYDPSLPNLAQINQAAYEALVESDAMADVAYYLASNPSEVYKFGSMSPVQAIKEVARLETKLTSKAAKPTSAPPPPKTVGGKSESVKDPNDMSVDEWMEWRRKQTT